MDASPLVSTESMDVSTKLGSPALTREGRMWGVDSGALGRIIGSTKDGAAES
jgi:hypothetical protein